MAFPRCLIQAGRSTAGLPPPPAVSAGSIPPPPCSAVQGCCALCSATKSPSFRKNIIPGKLICESASPGACSRPGQHAGVAPCQHAPTMRMEASGSVTTTILPDACPSLQATHAAAFSIARCGAARRAQTSRKP